MNLPGLSNVLTAVMAANPGVDRVAIRTKCKHDGTLTARVLMSRKGIATTVATRMGSNAHRRITYAMMEASVGMPDVVPQAMLNQFKTAVDQVVALLEPAFIQGVLGRETLYLWILRAPEADAQVELMHSDLADVALREPPPADQVPVDLDDPDDGPAAGLQPPAHRAGAPVVRNIELRPAVPGQGLRNFDEEIRNLINGKK